MSNKNLFKELSIIGGGELSGGEKLIGKISFLRKLKNFT